MTRQPKNEAFARTSFLQGANAAYIEQMQAQYERNPGSVSDEWRRFFAGTLVRSVEMAEASARLEALVGAGKLAAVRLEGAASTPCYLLADDLPVLEQVHAGHLPEAWQPLETSTEEEMILPFAVGRCERPWARLAPV